MSVGPEEGSLVVGGKVGLLVVGGKVGPVEGSVVFGVLVGAVVVGVLVGPEEGWEVVGSLVVGVLVVGAMVGLLVVGGVVTSFSKADMITLVVDKVGLEEGAPVIAGVLVGDVVGTTMSKAYESSATATIPGFLFSKADIITLVVDKEGWDEAASVIAGVLVGDVVGSTMSKAYESSAMATILGF